jgi:hypothetical protein
MVLTDEERKAKAREYYKKIKNKRQEYAKRPDVIARRKLARGSPDGKKKIKEYNSRPEVIQRKKEYHEKPENKLKRKEYYEKPENKLKKKEYRSRPEIKKMKKEYDQRPDVIAREKARQQTPEYKAKNKAYRERPEVKKRIKIYKSRPDVKAKSNARKLATNAKTKSIKMDKRLKILQYYSELLSNSNIPCCKCCGANSHIDFLAIDHIAGAKQMDSEPELVKLGYSSKLEGSMLHNWIIENDYPKGFQILCTSCNFAKGMTKNNNKCPMENKPH